MLFVAFCCSFWSLGLVSICHLLLFAALHCLFLFLRCIQFYLKNQNRQIPLIAHFGFLLLVLVFCRSFHLNIAVLVLVFCWSEKPKRATKGKKVLKKPDLRTESSVHLISVLPSCSSIYTGTSYKGNLSSVNGCCQPVIECL